MENLAKNPYSQSVPMDNELKIHRRRYSQVSDAIPNATVKSICTKPDGFNPRTNRLSGRSTNRLNDGSRRPPLRELYVNICKYLYLWKIWLKIHTHSLRLWIMS